MRDVCHAQCTAMLELLGGSQAARSEVRNGSRSLPLEQSAQEGVIYQEGSIYYQEGPIYSTDSAEKPPVFRKPLESIQKRSRKFAVKCLNRRKRRKQRFFWFPLQLRTHIEITDR